MRRLNDLSARVTLRFSALPLYSSQRCHRKMSVLHVALRRVLALAMALLLLPIWRGELWAQEAYSRQLPPDAGYAGQPYQSDVYPQRGNGQIVQPLNAVRLQQLVAPVALYPDRLVALVLTASTYAPQVAEADH